MSFFSHNILVYNLKKPLQAHEIEITGIKAIFHQKQKQQKSKLSLLSLQFYDIVVKNLISTINSTYQLQGVNFTSAAVRIVQLNDFNLQPQTKIPPRSIQTLNRSKSVKINSITSASVLALRRSIVLKASSLAANSSRRKRRALRSDARILAADSFAVFRMMSAYALFSAPIF